MVRRAVLLVVVIVALVVVYRLGFANGGSNPNKVSPGPAACGQACDSGP